jgi:hypothetical protein
MTNREASNQIVKALAMATELMDNDVSFEQAAGVQLNQGPFWSAVVKATGRDGECSEATRIAALYFLACMEWKARKLVRVK